MFCRKCGAEMSDTAKFCPKCGTATEHMQDKIEPIEDNNIIISLKPKFHLVYQTLSAIGKAILIILIFLLYAYGDDYAIEVYMALIPIVAVIVVIYILGKLIFGKLQYNNLQFNFYKTKVEYIDGFLNKEQKELKYKSIREVTMTQNILERICGIGTIKIFTNASSGLYNNTSKHNTMRGKNGLHIHCIKDVAEQYKKIKQIIDEGTPED